MTGCNVMRGVKIILYHVDFFSEVSQASVSDAYNGCLKNLGLGVGAESVWLAPYL